MNQLSENNYGFPIEKTDLENLADLEMLAKSLVWYTPIQMERGEHLNDVENKKGERAWSISRESGKFLYEFIIKNKIRNILELGTSIGFSTLWMSLALKFNSKQNSAHNPVISSNDDIGTIKPEITSFEINPKKIEIARGFLNKSAVSDSVQIIEGEIIDTLPIFVKGKIKTKLDLIFFDADRSNYGKYLDILYPLISNNTYLIVDNAIDMKKRLNPFVEKLKNDEWDMKTLEIGDGLLVCKPIPKITKNVV